MKEFELVLPAYNEAENLPNLIQRAVQSAQASGYTPANFQLVVVNNGSRDNSAQKLKELAAIHPGWFRVVDVPVNKGYGYGVFQGLKNTQAKYVGWSHADLQCDPSDSFKALAVVKSAPKLFAKGYRSGRNWKDRMVTNVFESLSHFLLGLNVREINAQPKVFSSELLAEIKNPPFTFAFDLYVLYCAARAGFRVETIPVVFPPRIHGLSKWSSNFFSRYKTILGIIRYIWNLSRTEGRVS